MDAARDPAAAAVDDSGAAAPRGRATFILPRSQNASRIRPGEGGAGEPRGPSGPGGESRHCRLVAQVCASPSANSAGRREEDMPRSAVARRCRTTAYVGGVLAACALAAAVSAGAQTGGAPRRARHGHDQPAPAARRPPVPSARTSTASPRRASRACPRRRSPAGSCASAARISGASRKSCSSARAGRPTTPPSPRARCSATRWSRACRAPRSPARWRSPAPTAPARVRPNGRWRSWRAPSLRPRPGSTRRSRPTPCSSAPGGPPSSPTCSAGASRPPCRSSSRASPTARPCAPGPRARSPPASRRP